VDFGEMTHKSAIAFVLAIAMAAAAHAAEPDFAVSTAYEPAPAVAGDVIRYTVTITNNGGDSTYSRIVTALPRGYFIRAQGDCSERSLNREDNRLVWHEGAYPAGAAKRCRIDLLSRRESAGTMAPLVTEITTPPDGYARHEGGPELSTPADPNTARIGATSVLIAFLLATLIGGAVVTHIARRRRARLRPVLGAWFVIALGVGFLLFFVGLAREDIRSHRDYRETACFIFDSAIRAFQGSGKHRASTYEPVVAVRYDALGVETYASAYPPASALSFGWLGFSRQTLERFSVGSVHPCWFDPDDVRTVLLERGPGGAYLFALLPLMALAYGALMLRMSMRR
jgi:hypothetical protein